MTKLEQVKQRLAIIDQIVNDDTEVSPPQQWIVGVDLGTADIQTVVLDGSGEPVAAFLDWANVVKDGVVVDYMGACQIVRSQIQRVEQKLGISVTSAITSYPPGTDPRISINVVESAAIEVEKVIDEPSSVADLLGIEEGAVVDIGGGTTGTAMIKAGKQIFSLDDPSGGRHVSLVIAGRLKVDDEEAERLKRTSYENPDIAVIVKPVIEKMADIVMSHLQGDTPQHMYLTGGGTLVNGVQSIFSATFPQTEIVTFEHALYLTPLAIASYGLGLTE
ncbi:ethanolamine utilization protein EutJ [Vibrio sp. SCSIO 43137]|uniref:ethanolamine utilization protein EutJ n=1 Tax=Vibrio sp. SCSIO 43137 TaxID=3021011 RepID=UPI0023071099|nr:ethanolamine utilization protein EutJ [Vibrio sp. SCSIO 43137]WCE28603.1 ethanolamine utilization protein EutJ [Vibrio sp. SCSIO 43137]